jgi:hypothetical protein
VVIFSSLKILFEEKSDISIEAVLAEGVRIGREGGICERLAQVGDYYTYVGISAGNGSHNIRV